MVIIPFHIKNEPNKIVGQLANQGIKGEVILTEFTKDWHPSLFRDYDLIEKDFIISPLELTHDPHASDDGY